MKVANEAYPKEAPCRFRHGETGARSSRGRCTPASTVRRRVPWSAGPRPAAVRRPGRPDPDAVRADSADRLVVLGDLNTATTDRVFDPLTRVLGDAQADAGQGFGFTWPAELPVTRPDHVLHRGLTSATAGMLRTPASDHRAVTAGFRW
ncbi:endonuclease/exonuclease/phosphatase family protein [Micromonospora sp. NPDC005257]|uniref:endonuclease/exonuclease/phosphatase family protein n=1 Tax=Micromonospora sp. NPDC005257 TaxID=3364230 RepID=UPI0036C48320